jgi:mannitol/fructose-specific phosphotransferase system IIA component (Ntr-type)
LAPNRRPGPARAPFAPPGEPGGRPVPPNRLEQALASYLGLKSSTKDAAIKELLKAAQAAKIFPKKHEAAFAKKLLERESIGSTGLGNSVAVPHLKHDEVATSSVVVARAPGGIEWQAIDGRPVSILFFVASPSGDPESHLQCLRWISSLARNADFRRFRQLTAQP